MAHIFEYSILSAVPDRSRGESVNIGIVVFLHDRVDVRIAEVAKIRALTGKDWTQYTNDFASRFETRFKSGQAAKNEILESPRLDPAFEASTISPFRVDDISQYESRVNEIMSCLVYRPKDEQAHEKVPRINTEISKHLRNIRVLARHDEVIDSHKVFRDYEVEIELKADFVQKNGVMRYATTLDLRKSKMDFKETALKVVVLDRAREISSGKCSCIGIYASLRPDAREVKNHIQLMRDYADDIYNWSDQLDRRRLTGFILDGLNAKGALV